MNLADHQRQSITAKVAGKASGALSLYLISTLSALLLGRYGLYEWEQQLMAGMLYSYVMPSPGLQRGLWPAGGAAG